MIRMLLHAHWPLNTNRVVTREFGCILFIFTILQPAGLAIVKPKTDVFELWIQYNLIIIIGYFWEYQTVKGSGTTELCLIWKAAQSHILHDTIGFPGSSPAEINLHLLTNWTWSSLNGPIKTNFTVRLPIVLTGIEQPLAKWSKKKKWTSQGLICWNHYNDIG